jgi:hypothetical protein
MQKTPFALVAYDRQTVILRVHTWLAHLLASPNVLPGWPSLHANEGHKTHPPSGLLTPRGLPLADHPEELLPPLVHTHGDHQAAPQGQLVL